MRLSQEEEEVSKLFSKEFLGGEHSRDQGTFLSKSEVVARRQERLGCEIKDIIKYLECRDFGGFTV